jgi:hypothetical protein
MTVVKNVKLLESCVRVNVKIKLLVGREGKFVDCEILCMEMRKVT